MQSTGIRKLLLSPALDETWCHFALRKKGIVNIALLHQKSLALHFAERTDRGNGNITLHFKTESRSRAPRQAISENPRAANGGSCAAQAFRGIDWIACRNNFHCTFADAA